MKHKALIISVTSFFLLVIGLSWYFDLFNNSVETIDTLIGKDYDFACEKYFKEKPNTHYTINVNHSLNEFDGGILNRKIILTDSIVDVYTWVYFNHKKTIWVGQTLTLKRQIIDATRYKNNVQF